LKPKRNEQGRFILCEIGYTWCEIRSGCPCDSQLMFQHLLKSLIKMKKHAIFILRAVSAFVEK